MVVDGSRIPRAQLFISMTFGICPKWHPAPYIVLYLVPYAGNRVPFGMHTLSFTHKLSPALIHNRLLMSAGVKIHQIKNVGIIMRITTFVLE